ncbi:integrase core domain-containing protein [Lentzea sp. NPDC004789]
MAPKVVDHSERRRELAEEWVYAQVFTSAQHRADAVPEFLHHHNHHRVHTALGGRPPIGRVDNFPGHFASRHRDAPVRPRVPPAPLRGTPLAS